MLTRSIIKRMNPQEKNHLYSGALAVGLCTGLIGYFNYRQYIRKDFLRSAGHYRFQQPFSNVTPWNHMFFTWYRMPEEEFKCHHLFKPYYIVGQLDLSKEILIPRRRYVNGQYMDGYDVINPIYCYEGGRINFSKMIGK